MADTDFERIYRRAKEDRRIIEEKLHMLEKEKHNRKSHGETAKKLVCEFINSEYASREILVSLIERIELTQDKNIIIKFRFKELGQKPLNGTVKPKMII